MDGDIHMLREVRIADLTVKLEQIAKIFLEMIQWPRYYGLAFFAQQGQFAPTTTIFCETR